MGSLYNIISELCEIKGVKPGKMCNDIGISRSLITDLKMGRKKTASAAALNKIASYFNVSIEYLLGEDETKKAPTVSGERDEADKVISFLSSLPPDRLRGILLALGAPEDVLAEVDRTEQER